MYCIIIGTRPRAASGAETLDLTKQKLLRQSVIRHPESMTEPPVSSALQLRLHRKSVAPSQYINIWKVVLQGNATDASQAVVRLKDSQRANVVWLHCWTAAQPAYS